MATTTRPAQLNDLPDPPDVLHALGSLDVLSLPCVTLVGSRRATAYGERVARSLGAAFARAGVCVISGLAHGIDVAAQRAALDSGGSVCAVLGTGLDVYYPVSHREIQTCIGANGLLLTEYAAGTTARPWHFPQRNRVMAALSQATIVIEAGDTSGALITAEIALDLGRAVGAVPGNIDSLESRGTNGLLHRTDVVPITDVASALAILGISSTVRKPNLQPDEDAVWRALPALSVEDLVARTQLPTARCLAAVASLELNHALTVGYDGSIRRSETGDI